MLVTDQMQLIRTVSLPLFSLTVSTKTWVPSSGFLFRTRVVEEREKAFFLLIELCSCCWNSGIVLS